MSRAGIAHVVLDPRTGAISTQGTIAVANDDVACPAIGVAQDGRGAIAFTLAGADRNVSTTGANGFGTCGGTRAPDFRASAGS